MQVDRTLPQHLRRTLVRGLAAAPERRFPDMDALLRELVRDRAPRAPLRYLALGTGCSALVGLALWLARPADEPPPAPPPAPADACARDPASCVAAAPDPRVEALSGQLELARGLLRDARPREALELLTALADTSRATLGHDHDLCHVIERERLALAGQLARPGARDAPP